MRHSRIAIGTVLAAMLGLSGTANAGATVDLIWQGSGTSAAAANPSDTITLDIMMTAGTEGLSSWGISVRFDADLLDELDVVSTTEFGLAPTITCTPFPGCFFGTPTLSNFTSGVSSVVESTTAQTGFVFTFEAGTLGNGVSASFGSFRIGEIVFQVTGNVAVDGADVETGFFNVGADGAFDNLGSPVAMTFNSATVNGPEPGTALLLGLGLLGLTVAGRRSRG